MWRLAFNAFCFVSFMILSSIACMNIENKGEPNKILYLIEQLESRDPIVRKNAVLQLGIIGPKAREAGPALLKLLDDEYSDVRIAAIKAIWQIRIIGNDVFMALKQRLDDENPDVRARVVALMAWIEFDTADVIPVLTHMLQDDSDTVRLNAVSALGIIGHNSKKANDAIYAMLFDEDPIVRAAAAVALSGIGNNPEDWIYTIINFFQEEENDIARAKYAGALGLLGSKGGEAIPYLIDALNDEDEEWVYSSIIWALGNIGPGDGATEALIEALEDGSLLIRAQAAEALGNHALEPGVVFALIKALDDEDYSVSIEAAFALGRIGPSAESAVVKLNKLAKYNLSDYTSKPNDVDYNYNNNYKHRDYDKDLMAAALFALAKINLEPEPYVTSLIKMIKGADPQLRVILAQTFGEIGSEPGLIDELVNLLDDEDGAVRCEAALALGRIGIDAVRALPKLQNIIDNDPEGRVYIAACEAIKQIIKSENN